MALTPDELERRHKYHAPRPDTQDELRHDTIRDEIAFLAETLDGWLEVWTESKSPREIALFHTALEEASFWAHAALARSRA